MGRSLTMPLAFLGAVGMWTTGYLGRFPGINAPPWFLGIVFLLGYLILGALAKVCGTPPKVAALAGVFTSSINALVLGSLLAEKKGLHLGLALVGALVLGGFLALLGWRFAPVKTGSLPLDGEALFAQVAVVAGFLLVVAGGLVTSQGAGLAVPDWPNTFGRNMFLFPLSRMTGGVYYEHAHRLFGSLVGLTVLGLALYLSWGKQPLSIKRWSWLMVVLVVVQGLLGGLRVTGRFTLAQDPSLLSPSSVLAVVHGMLGQLILAGLVAQALWVSPYFQQQTRALEPPQRLFWPQVLWALLVLQLAVGALQRHLFWGILVHISLAVLVLGLAAMGGGFLSARPDHHLRMLGKTLISLAFLQFVLGFFAFWVREFPPRPRAQSALEVFVVTAHQAGGAGLLALTTVIALWTWKKSLPSRVDR